MVICSLYVNVVLICHLYVVIDTPESVSLEFVLQRELGLLHMLPCDFILFFPLYPEQQCLVFLSKPK